MEFSISPTQNYVYVLIRLKMSDKMYGIVQDTLICFYEEKSVAFLVGSQVKPGETLMASAIRHCHHLVNFRLAHNFRPFIFS